MTIDPLEFGVKDIFLVAETAELQQLYIKFNVNIYSCKEEYADIQPDHREDARAENYMKGFRNKTVVNGTTTEFYFDILESETQFP